MANMVQADKFDGGDIDDYLEHFDICALANGWEQERKALMIATCLKGEALEVFKTLDGEERKDYEIVKRTLRSAFRADDFKYTALNEFHARTMFPSETPQKYLFELKRLINKAFPELGEDAREQLLFDQYIRGLPKIVHENIRISPEIKTSSDALRRAQVLIRTHKESIQQTEFVSSMNQVENKITESSEKASVSQVAIDEAVKLISERIKSTQISDADGIVCSVRRGNFNRRPMEGRGQRKVICFECHGEGHFAEECANNLRKIRREIRCYGCGRMGHLKRNCPDQQRTNESNLNSRGSVGRAETRPQRF